MGAAITMSVMHIGQRWMPAAHLRQQSGVVLLQAGARRTLMAAWEARRMLGPGHCQAGLCWAMQPAGRKAAAVVPPMCRSWHV